MRQVTKTMPTGNATAIATTTAVTDALGVDALLGLRGDGRRYSTMTGACMPSS
jgi:hypothetical protein